MKEGYEPPFLLDYPPILWRPPTSAVYCCTRFFISNLNFQFRPEVPKGLEANSEKLRVAILDFMCLKCFSHLHFARSKWPIHALF